MSENLTETPRTDALLNNGCHELDHEDWYALCNHANQLERELIASQAALSAAEQRAEAMGVAASFRGYAALGTGQYLLCACPRTDELPPELVISVATPEERAGRTIGDLRDTTPGKVINPEVMAVRIAFFSVAGLDALEQQLRILREESFSHASDCAVHNAPALPVGECDCGLQAALAAQPSAGEDARDAARYRYLQHRVSGDRYPSGVARFRLPDIQAHEGIFKGSVAEHFDAAIDAAIAAGGKGR